MATVEGTRHPIKDELNFPSRLVCPCEGPCLPSAPCLPGFPQRKPETGQHRGHSTPPTQKTPHLAPGPATEPGGQLGAAPATPQGTVSAVQGHCLHSDLSCRRQVPGRASSDSITLNPPFKPTSRGPGRRRGPESPSPAPRGQPFINRSTEHRSGRTAGATGTRHKRLPRKLSKHDAMISVPAPSCMTSGGHLAFLGLSFSSSKMNGDNGICLTRLL